MSKEIKVERLSQELFNQFQSLYYSSVNEDNTRHNQGLFDMSTYSYIFLVDSKPIACFGLVILWHGVGECWMMGSPDIGNHTHQLIKTLRSLTDELLSCGLTRVQIYINNTHRLNKWAKLLGFTFEGVLRKHAITGEDNAIYAKIWE